jgi:hypothetical protein
MKSIHFNVSALWRSLRLFAAACVCALMLFSNALPAYSFPNPFAPPQESAQASDPTKGEDKLLGIEEGAQKSAIREQDLLSGEEVTQKSNEGPIPVNEVQGAADADKMKNPANSQGETIEGILQDKLEEATGQ